MKKAGSQHKFTPHSRMLRRGSCDGRSREGRFLATVRHELTEMVAGKPSPAERTVIERIAWIRLHLAVIDERVAQGAVLSAHDMRSYTAYNSTLIALMRQLRLLGNGKAEPEPSEPSLAELMAVAEAKRRAQTAA